MSTYIPSNLFPSVLGKCNKVIDVDVNEGSRSLRLFKEVERTEPDERRT